MLFCFGLFALLLYYTVVANAECSFTYSNTSKHIEAKSTEYESQGFNQCEFIIQASSHHYIELNFTRFTGFEATSMHGVGMAQEQSEEKKKESAGSDMAGPSQRKEGGTEESGPLPRPTLPSVSKLASVLSSSSAASTVIVHADKAVPGSSATSVAHDTTSPVVSISLTSKNRMPTCLPKLEIREVFGEGNETTSHVICHKHNNHRTPLVFHYASSVRIVYVWEQEQSSGFTLYFDFSKEKCAFKCDGQRCLTDKLVLCNGHYDCQDKSDEQQPLCQLQTITPASSDLDSDSLVKIILIPTCLVVLILAGVVYLIGRYHCTALSRTLHRDAGEGGHLTCPQSHSSEGFITSAGSLGECSEQAVALLPNGQSKKSSWSPPHHPPLSPPKSAEVGFPPNIPVSQDGEEGYTTSQIRLLHPRYRVQHPELFKPPPNKTVFDRESPPPYSQHPSSGSFGCGSAPTSSSAFCMGGSVKGSVRVVRDCDGQPVVSRCYSMFTPSLPNSALNGVGARDSDPTSLGVHQLQRQQPYVQLKSQTRQQGTCTFSVSNTAPPAPNSLPPLLIDPSLNAISSCDTFRFNSPISQLLDIGRSASVSGCGGGHGDRRFRRGERQRGRREDGERERTRGGGGRGGGDSSEELALSSSDVSFSDSGSLESDKSRASPEV